MKQDSMGIPVIGGYIFQEQIPFLAMKLGILPIEFVHELGMDIGG
jgi:hypothetical protein